MTAASIVAVIPARGGSKGIPGKNVHELAGKPLIVHTIEHALAASRVTRVLVSTDDQRIADVSAASGAGVIWRPAEISGDTASSESALIHAVHALKADGDVLPDLVVFLQCTSPIRRAGDIDGAIAALEEQGADSVLSVSPSHRFLWQETATGAQSINYDYRARPRRQDMQPQFVENGSIYVLKPAHLLAEGNRLAGKIALYVMDDDAAVDIDSMSDMVHAEFILRSRIRSGSPA